jgi:two-component system, chemotaxis family, CheB/CheR fusion protein
LSDSKHDAKPFYIVGIGASAGGLAALQQFFDHTPDKSGMAFVIIQHLSPDFKSQMDELLSRHTSMPVHQVTENVLMEPDHIYLNISMTQMGVQKRTLLLTQVSQDQHVELPIDVFFRSLASEAGAQAVGIILSGTGKDGAAGIQAIARGGGMVAVQAPDSAQFSAMPQNAVDTGICDFVLPPEQIPAILLEHAANPDVLPAEDAEDAERLETPELPESPEEYARIFELLHGEYSLDFSKYKMGTVGRRIKRRMGYRRLKEIPDYVAVLSADQNELDDLYHDLLIGVTEFFRDEKAFEYLESTILPELFAALAPDQDMRAWSAGCATGEEAYSLAILLVEKAAELNFTGKISVFATDVHKRTLDAAAQGIFTRDRLAKVSAARLERFFTEVDKNLFKVKSDLRKLLTFAHHDLTRDIPFSKLDLVCCRNLLIYLQPEAQKKVLSLFHFALRMNGILFLGKSEGIGSLASEFEALSTQNKVFRKIRDQKVALELDSARKGQQPILPRAGVQPLPQRPATLDRRVLSDYDMLLEKHIPPGVLVDERFRIIHCFGNVAQFLKTLKGRLETDILSMTDENLHIALSTSLQKVRKTGIRVVTRNVLIKMAGDEYLVDVTVDPLSYEMTSTLHYHIFFERIHKEQPPAPERLLEVDLNAFEPSLYYQQHLADLEMELQSTRADLSATQETLQATSEALNATNEELQAANEELQSTNEELNSANEELHSTNEELYSVNTEFEHSNVELKQLNVDLVNLLTSIDSGIIFLDKQMHIRKFNPASSAFFKLLPQDVGRPIDHIAYQLANQSELLADIRSVLQEGEVIEKEVITREGEWLLSRIVPFQSEANSREGVVITFTNVSRLKEAELKVGRLNEELAIRVGELEQTYLRLETETGERIHTMEELRRKDQMMIQQSRMAAMGEMLGNIAHQWRQPLNVLGLQVQELRASYKLGSFSEQLLDASVSRVMEIIQHMSQTIDDFRDFLLVDKIKQVFKVDEVIRKSVTLIEAGLREHNIALDISSTGTPRINGHPNQFGQVMINILMNARDAFLEHPQNPRCITVRSWEENGKAVVTVADTAGGIRQEIIGKIFDAYFTTKPLGKGTGVGLFMSNAIIEKSMGGRLTARNLDGGAEFRIEV